MKFHEGNCTLSNAIGEVARNEERQRTAVGDADSAVGADDFGGCLGVRLRPS